MTKTVQFHLNEIPRIIKFIETENRMVVTRDWGRGRNGEYCLMDTEFLFCKMKSFRDWLHNNVNVL